MAVAAPTPDIVAAILAPTSRVIRRVDIYEEDGSTPFVLDAPTIDGTINASGSRDERRTLDISFENIDNQLQHFPGGFWYDKVIKVYRGVDTGTTKWLAQLGEFLIDKIAEDNFPPKLAVTGRDYTKRLITSKFPAATTFVKGSPLEETIRTIALNGGITKFSFPTTDKVLGKDFTFDRGYQRNKACSDLASAYGYEIFFDPQGYYTLREFQDPVTSPVIWTFKTGTPDGNLAKFTKSTDDTRIYNHVVVSGGASDQVPVWAEARNTNPDSPTNIDQLGDRVYEYSSTFITTTAQAQDVADKFLAVHALESFEVALESLVFPWLDVNEIVEFMDPSPAPGDPTRFLLTDLSIPITLGTMSGTAKRVTIVG